MATTPTERPASITTFATEEKQVGRGFVSDLDLDYVDGLASDLAAILSEHGVAECCYQPGDGTRYALVFVPLAALRSGRPRTKNGQIWERHAVVGMKTRGADDGADGSGFYDPTGFLVCRVEGACYPLQMKWRGSAIAAGYVAEHWDIGFASAMSLSILFRAISHYLDA